MRFQIDIEKSKKVKKLVFQKKWTGQVSDYLTESFVLIPIAALSVMSIYYEITDYQTSTLAIIIAVLALITIGGILYSMINTSNLKSHYGFSRTQNKSDVIKISEINNWKIINEGVDYKTFLVADKWSGFHNGKYLTVIFQKNELLLNCYCIDFFHAISPYHWIGNRITENRFIKQIELIKNAP